MSRNTFERVVRALGAQVRSALGRAVRREVGRALEHIRARLSGGSGAMDATEPAKAAASGPPPSQIAPGASEPPAERPGGSPSPRAEPLVDINSASREELMGLPGIGQARAAAILAGRPYEAEEDLVERRILPERVFDGIERAICVGADVERGRALRRGGEVTASHR